MFSIILSLKSLHHTMMRRFEKESKDFDATGGQLMVLKFLYDHENEDVYQKDIEKFIDVRGSTATVILQSLTKKGYIKRVSCSNDGRLKKIVLCEKAKKVIVEFEQRMAKLEIEIENGLSMQDKENFSLIVDKIKHNIEYKEN